MYHLTKDGFIFLVMGFTGEKAAQIKEAYIAAFNRMEAELTRHTRKDLTILLVATQAETERLDTQYKGLQEKCRRMCERITIRPISGLTETYTVVIRFDTTAHLQQWMESPVRAGLIEKVSSLLVTGDDFFVSSGLDFWFTAEGAKAKVPVRWKQYLVTWSAIYPLALGVPLVVVPMLQRIGISPDNHLLTTLIVTGIVVFLMVYIVMPRYTKLIKRWLFT